MQSVGSLAGWAGLGWRCTADGWQMAGVGVAAGLLGEDVDELVAWAE